MAAPSPARQRLTEKLAELHEAERAAEVLRAAEMPARNAWIAATDALEAATAAEPEAAAVAVEHAINQFAGVAVAEPAVSVEGARLAVRLAEDDVRTCRAALDEISRRARATSDQMPDLRHWVADAAKRLLWAEAAPVIGRIIEEFRDHQSRLVELGRAIRFFHGLAPHPPEHEGLPATLRSVADDFEMRAPVAWECAANSGSILEAQYRDVLDALQRDASAKVP